MAQLRQLNRLSPWENVAGIERAQLKPSTPHVDTVALAGPLPTGSARLMLVPPGRGDAEVVLDDPTGIHIPMPTNVCFFGEGLRQVAIASLGGQVVKAIDLGIAGAAVHYPRLPAAGP